MIPFFRDHPRELVPGWGSLNVKGRELMLELALEHPIAGGNTTVATAVHNVETEVDAVDDANDLEEVDRVRAQHLDQCRLGKRRGFEGLAVDDKNRVADAVAGAGQAQW